MFIFQGDPPIWNEIVGNGHRLSKNHRLGRLECDIEWYASGRNWGSGFADFAGFWAWVFHSGLAVLSLRRPTSSPLSLSPCGRWGGCESGTTAKVGAAAGSWSGCWWERRGSPRATTWSSRVSGTRALLALHVLQLRLWALVLGRLSPTTRAREQNKGLRMSLVQERGGPAGGA